jgi:hypothetical protein
MSGAWVVIGRLDAAPLIDGTVARLAQRLAGGKVNGRGLRLAAMQECRLLPFGHTSGPNG